MQGKAVACEERAKTFKICHLEVIKKQISKPRRREKQDAEYRCHQKCSKEEE